MEYRLPTDTSTDTNHSLNLTQKQDPSMQPLPSHRRHWLASVAALGALPLTAGAATLTTPQTPPPTNDATDESRNKIVYQLNQADDAYQEAILNSISALLKKYVDDVQIAVVVWGPGIHLLAKKPKRPVPALLQQRVRSMAEAYGVRFIACGNTMHTVGWEKADMLDFAQVEEVGAAAVMEFQAKGYAYLAW